MNLYTYANKRIEKHSWSSQKKLPDDTLWCDLLNPTKQEEEWLEQQLNLQVPTREEMVEIELSNRLYAENNVLFCTISVSTMLDSPEPEIHAITFIIKNNLLVTLRYCEPHAFKVYANHLCEQHELNPNSISIALSLYEALINRFADTLENSSRTLDELNKKLFRPAMISKAHRDEHMPHYEDLLRLIGIQGDLLSKIRESLVSLTRAMTFLAGSAYITPSKEEIEKNNILLKDITALSDQANFLSNRVSFLLDGALGMVSIQQNAIIKIFSVAAVVFLPPTLVASIYGMNFNAMPELAWKWGYPFAIALMVFSAWLPFRYFKKKKWL